MLITDVRIGTADLNEAARFYRDVLELPVTLSDGTAVVTVGRSTMTLTETPGLRESNHVAFTIPSNRFAEAKKWLSDRVELMSWKAGETELRLGEPWDSESAYFLGPDSILLEVIARHRLANPSDEPFSSAQLLCVTPNANWLEYIDWWNPILESPLEIRDGMAIVTGAAGAGVAWDEKAVGRYSA